MQNILPGLKLNCKNSTKATIYSIFRWPIGKSVLCFFNTGNGCPALPNVKIKASVIRTYFFFSLSLRKHLPWTNHGAARARRLSNAKKKTPPSHAISSHENTCTHLLLCLSSFIKLHVSHRRLLPGRSPSEVDSHRRLFPGCSPSEVYSKPESCWVLWWLTNGPEFPSMCTNQSESLDFVDLNLPHICVLWQ